ncbi:MAG: glycoside hydrolase family 2 protein [Butyrivibrio sp.]|nr:glycoside hydrolase family 2 protein [Butyrivibrio sp.]
MKKIVLSDWTIRRIKDKAVYSTKVPGSILSTLQENSVIPDPFVGDNEKYALEMMEEDFEYETVFDCDIQLLTSDRVELVFEGIDTIADIILNDKTILHAENMHRTYRIDVTQSLKEKENSLKVYFHSPTKYIREAYKECECDGSEDAMEGFANIRKAHYMFGWDWGPRIPDAGLFRPVSLIGIEKAKIDNVRIHQEHSEGKVDLCLYIDDEVITDNVDISYDVRITSPDGDEKVINNYKGQMIPIEDPMLWWPNGFGEQNLYTVTVIQKAGDTITDKVTKGIGLRTMTITRKKDQWGESFSHCVNGVDIFALGADYIPEDNYLSRITPERTRQLLEDCKTANFNSIRVWGGGFFPGDEFYDICDELGLIVWQDLMFACAVYDLNENFEDNIHQEIKDNVRRIEGHACLGLISGNNEMEQFVKEGVWVKTHKQKADYIKMYEYLFPKWIHEYAPDTFYWPSSPSSGGSFDNPNDDSRGDVHYWEVWHSNKPFTEFRKHFFRYLSEFGFQSIPSRKTLEKVMEREEDFNLFSYNMEKHQRNSSANAKIMQYMQSTFKYPCDFDVLTYASQLLAGEAIRYGVEHFRRNRGRCMGAIYWQLNDCWPVISWSSIDYYGRWKALHYYAQRFFSPVLVSCEETSTVSEGILVNSEKTDFTPSIRLNISNETMSDKELTLEWELRNAAGEIITPEIRKIKTRDAKVVKVPALSAVWLDKVSLPGIDIYSNYVSFRVRDKNKILSTGTAFFVPAKYFHFEDPELKITVVSEKELMVEAKAFAKNVEIRNRDDDLVLEDNFFDMNPGQRIIEVKRGQPDGLTVRSVYDIH